MKILLVASSYPHAGNPFSGVFNERSAAVLRELCDAVGLLVPRPFAPPVLRSLAPRWRIYAGIPACETRNGLLIRRPGYPQLPRLAAGFCFEVGAYFFSRRVAREMHRLTDFDAILALDIEAGGLAWRLGDDLGIPACGWVSGNYFQVSPSSFSGRALQRTLRRLQVIFYQSHELMQKAAEFLHVTFDGMLHDRHVVLPRGIPEPPLLRRDDVRKRVRGEWGIADDEIVILSIGRITRDKGVYELLEAISEAAARNSRITAVLVGSLPAFDETADVQQVLDEVPMLQRHVKLLPACKPERVWEFLCAADIFAFASHAEGMPNSLLEAMAMGVPAVAFSIPPVQEVEAGMKALLTVPLGDVKLLSEAILDLAAAPGERISLGQRGRSRVMDGFMAEQNMHKAVRMMEQMLPRQNGGRPRWLTGSS